MSLFTGIYEETFIKNGIKHKDYLKKLESSVQGAWRSKYGKTVEGSLNEALLNDLGKPIKAFIDYVKLNYSRHCIPDDKVSGLASLPVDYVWLDQREDKQQPTLKKLPTGEALNGPKAYEMILPYFTTNSMKANEIYDLGKRMLDSLYPQALEIAKAYTKESDSIKAAARFKAEFVDSPMSYFNATPIPANESGSDAFQKCQSLETAKKFCPVRYQSMMNWFDYVQTTLSILHPKIRSFFYDTESRASTPNCPLKMVAKFNPSSGSQSYNSAGTSCKRPCYYNLPFFLTPHGPRYGAISVAGHEGRPGHHTQVSCLLAFYIYILTIFRSKIFKIHYYYVLIISFHVVTAGHERLHRRGNEGISLPGPSLHLAVFCFAFVLPVFAPFIQRDSKLSHCCL